MKWNPILAATLEQRQGIARDLRLMRRIASIAYEVAAMPLSQRSINDETRLTAAQFALTDVFGWAPSKHRTLAQSFVNLARKGTRFTLTGYLMDAALSYGVARVEDFPPETVRLLTKRTNADSIERELVMRYHEATGTTFRR